MRVSGCSFALRRFKRRVDAFGVKWELTVEVQSYFAEVEIPYATDSRNCSILHLQDSRVKVTMDDVGFGISGSVAKLSLCDRPGPLRDHYLLKAELFAESHPLSFNFYKYRREDNELRRQFDGSLRLTSLDHLYFVVTSRFGLNMNSFFQMMADRYENFLQLRKRDSYTTRGSFGFRLHLHADINNVTFIVPESVVSSTVVLAKVRRLTLRSSAELRKADPSERQSVNGIAEHLIDTVVAHFESTEFVKALKRDDLSAFDKPYCSYGVEYFVIQKSLCKSDVDVEATFSRHLCPECLCRVNELNARVHSNVSQAICLHPEEVQMFRRLMKENVGEYVRFLEPRVNRETDLRAEFNMSPGTRVLVYLNSISLIFPTTPVEAGTGSITLRDLNVRLEICTYVRSRLSCTFFVDAFEMFARRTADNDPKAASEPCKRKLHSLTLGETKLPVEVTCHWNATRLSICCVVCDIRFVCMPTWLKAFMEYVLVNLCVNTGDSISNPKPPGLDGQAPDSFSVSCKLTLIGCQLYIGHSFDPESVAVLAKTSGSLQAACKQGIVTLEVLLDSIELFECQPYLNPSRSIPISNAFSAALSANTKLSHFHEYTLREGNFAKRRTEVSTTIRCDDVCMRVSLCDLLMLEKFIKAYYTKAAGSRPSVDNRRPIEYGSRIEIDRLTVVLVEYERSRQPIVRLSVQDAELEVQYAERRRKVWTVCGHFKLVSDFYNPNFGAWEPLVEELRVKDFLWIMNRISCCSSLLVYGIPRGSELTIMESTLRQLLQRYQQWPEYWEMASRSCSRIFTLPTAARCQVKNECGIPLWVAVRPYRAAVPDDAWVCAQPKKSEFLFYSVDYSREEVFHELIVRSLPRCESLAVSIRRAGSYCKPLVIPWLVNSDGQKPLEIEATVPVRCTVSVEGSGLHSVVISTALRLHNCLPFDLTVRLMPPSEAALAPMIVPVVHRSTFGVPINHWRSAISVAVVGKSCYSCPVDWQQVAAARPSRYAVECRRLASAKYIILSMNVTKRRFKGKWLCHGPNINEHLITLLPAALFINTLPYSATVKCETGGGTCNFTVPSGDSAPLLSVIDAGLLNVFLMVGEFESSKPFVVDLNPADHSVDNFSVPLLDCRKRLLNINVQTNMSASGCLEIVLKAPFMFVNRTNLAIIVKQVGADTLAAGQTDSHEEVAREEPLMFSFSDPEAPQRCHMRIGLRFGTVMEAPWCDHFPLVQGIAFRDLRVILDSGQVRIYHIGICIESMKGPSKGCLLVNFTCRYLLVNDSAHTVLVRQATQNSGPALRLPPNGHSVWHLPFPHLPPLISIQLAERTYWTEEFLVDQLTSFTLYLRGVDGITHFLLVEIVLEGAMFRVKFSSAYHLPPPITLLNMSCVPVTFHQKGCSAAHLRSTLLPRALSCYNWDNWLGQKQLVLSVYRAASLCFDFTKKRAVYNLSYGVQFYIAFGMQESLSDALVLEAKETGFVFLTSMNLEYGNQLWQETADGSLMNVGQSSRLQRSGSVGQLVVLDVDESEGSHSEPLLCVRRAESSRSETQRWTFDSNKLKLVSRNGFASVRSVDYFSSVFLASGSSNLVNNVFVRRCPTRPGSGALQVVVKADSPTHEVIISECCKPANGDDEALRDAAWLHPKVHNNRKLVERQRDRLVKVDDALLSCCFFIPDIGVSVVNERNEELMYFRFDDVAVNFIRTERVNKLSVQAYSIQGDNQLRNTNNWQFLQVHPELPEEMTKFKPALSLQIHWRFMPPLFDVQRAVVKLDRTVLQLEENLLWKLLDLFDLRRWAGTSCRSKANDWSRVQRKLDRLFYVEALCVSIRKLFLSVTTDTLLPKQLLQVKGEHGFNLVRFQNAPVNILPFQQVRCVQTFKFFTSALRSHFARTLRNQAMKIFGSVDFLGNPIGLFRELSGGIHELVIEGNLSGFVYGLWHGLSNSAARFTSALAEGVGIISMGSSNEFRTQLQLNSPQSAVEHLVDGMRGFGAGIFDGMTSLVSHAVDGAVDHGFQGLVTGIGRGLVGTVTRPVQGILALVSGAATAAKEAASKNAPLQPFFAPNRLRPARSTISFDLTVPRYDQTWVDVAALLFKERADKDSFDKQVLAVLRLNKADDVVTLFAACPRRYYVVECQRGTTKVIASNAYTEVCSCKLLFARANDSEKVCVVIVHNITNVELRQLEIDCPDEKTARTVLQLIEQGQRMYAGLSGALEAPVQLPCVCSGNRAELVD
uniref:Ricin B-type lectin domain-containing protein n=1 Tax=Trichuris muris TaxID=70415 RepID=A0A5S6Q841_TRIMR